MNYDYKALVELIEANGLDLVDTSNLKHYQGEKIILPISKRQRS